MRQFRTQEMHEDEVGAGCFKSLGFFMKEVFAVLFVVSAWGMSH